MAAVSYLSRVVPGSRVDSPAPPDNPFSGSGASADLGLGRVQAAGRENGVTVVDEDRSIAYGGTVPSPAGPIRLAVAEGGALLMVRFAEGAYPLSLEASLSRLGYRLVEDGERTGPAVMQVAEYWRGERGAFDLPLRLSGSDWQFAVWAALRTIPLGETRTYAELASSAGRPGAARAAGRANATNRLPIVVPCHRVIGSNGALTGFAGGVRFKALLLEHERRASGRS